MKFVENGKRGRNNMNKKRYTYEFIRVPFFKGTPVYWDQIFYNNGDIYYGYRFFCFSVRVRDNSWVK